jgi:bifunctional non-homologous end joining protein LigD
MQRTHERRPSERAWKHTVANTLTVYRSKRDFTKTPEPDSSAKATPSSERRYVIQKHAARRLHYDLRLELDGVFKSWAITRGPSLDPRDKRLAVEVEDESQRRYS